MDVVYGSFSDLVTATAAVIALAFGFRQLSQASTIRDLEFLNAQREQIGVHWQRYRNAVVRAVDDVDFEFGELLDCYERTCFSMNQNMVGSKTQEFMRDHVLEVLLALMSDEETYQRMLALKSGPRTYKEITLFCANNRKSVDEIHEKRLELLFPSKH